MSLCVCAPGMNIGWDSPESNYVAFKIVTNSRNQTNDDVAE